MDFGNVLWPNAAFLQLGDSLTSQNSRYSLVMRADGLVIESDHNTEVMLWQGDTAFRLVMQADGNLVLYQSDGTPRFNTGTEGNPGTIAVMQDDGNLVLYKSPAIWASNTAGL